MTRRHCSICHRTGHDARRHRRNPETPQLEAQLSREEARLVRAAERGSARGVTRWERSIDRLAQRYIEPKDAVGHGFAVRTVRGKVVRYPIRYSLMSADDYSPDRAHEGAYWRQLEREDASREFAEHLERAEAAYKRKLAYSPERAKALRERRKREVSVSPTASRKAYAAAQAKADREGKTLVVRARGGGNAAQTAYFARRYGNQGTPD